MQVSTAEDTCICITAECTYICPSAESTNICHSAVCTYICLSAEFTYICHSVTVIIMSNRLYDDSDIEGGMEYLDYEDSVDEQEES